uniref:Glyoxylate reductase/hydroxypyruvate reductase n=1 Tax=Phallusia mammillata TaxID=59560 RepID=A0A6F9DDZ7_9ASCI|nr:glyoxylate reductase/hydroxypyruvate reductase [Phallusia mammillata]
MSGKLKVFVTARLPAVAVNILRERFDVSMWDSENDIPKDILLEKSRGKDGLLCLLTNKIDKKVLDEAGKQLRVVSTMSVGLDHIDLNECKARGIKVGYTPDILTSATAELGVGLLLATSRRIVEGTNAAKNGSWGTWKPMWLCGPSLEGSTVGFFGLGRIGLAILQRLKPFGVKCFKYNTLNEKTKEFETEHGVTYATFNDLLATSDFLISCSSLTSATKNIFNKEAFDMMKSTSIFINIARGGVVMQDDLCQALIDGKIRAAGLDVTTPEPLPTDHPLFQLPNCVITPHIGSATDETRTAMAVLAARNLLAGLENAPMPSPYEL